MPNKIETNPTSYLINGNKYPRITHIISTIERFGLAEWEDHVGYEKAREIRKEAGDFGTSIHELTALHDTGKQKAVARILTKTPHLIPFWVAWHNWREEYIQEIVAVEIIVWSDKLQCAGRIDRVMIMKGDKYPTIFDLKTGSLYDEIGMQLAGYKLCYNEKRKPKVRRTVAVHMPRKEPGKLVVKDYTDERYIREFKATLKDYKALRFDE